MKKFSHLTVQERVQHLMQQGYLSLDEAQHLLTRQTLSPRLAEQCIENVVGYFQLPIGVAEGFVIDGRKYMIPMAVEETSIIAAASKTAKWIQKQGGRITTRNLSQWAHGQIQFAKIQNPDQFSRLVHKNKNRWLALANQQVASKLVARGGGVREISFRFLKSRTPLKPQSHQKPRPPVAHGHLNAADSHPADINTSQPLGMAAAKLNTSQPFGMAVLHVYVDVCDAMGANIINQTCEFLKPHIEHDTGEKVTMCIVSNLADKKLSCARVQIPNADPDLAAAIEQASLFAHTDPYRACTHNKGILNGIDAVLLATGNDWRAVEAGLHAWAACGKATGSDTAGGDAAGGDVAGGDAAGGDVAGGDVAGGDAAGGDVAGGDAAGGDAAGGDAAGGDAAGGDATGDIGTGDHANGDHANSGGDKWRSLQLKQQERIGLQDAQKSLTSIQHDPRWCSGSYRSLTSWSVQGTQLVGYFEGPFMLGTVGGVTTLHPTAQAMLNMMGVKSASHLARVCAAVGLVQNLGALRALVGPGIVEGHMRLHCKNLAAHAGATRHETPQVVQILQTRLKQQKRIGLQDAQKSLTQLRQTAPSPFRRPVSTT